MRERKGGGVDGWGSSHAADDRPLPRAAMGLRSSRSPRGAAPTSGNTSVRILYVDHTTALGGAEHSLLGLLRTLDRGRFEPVLACPPGPLADRAHQVDVAIAQLELEKLRTWNPLAAMGRLWRGRRLLHELLAGRRVDAVHANTLRAAAYVSRVARVRGVPFVWHVRDYQMPRWARARLLRRCDRAIATSNFLAASLGDSPKVRIVRNGVDVADVPDEAAARAFRDELGLPHDAPVVGCLGRIRPWKGQAQFLEVVAELAPRVPQARFLIVGDTLFPDRGRDYVGDLKRLAESLGVAGRVAFAGHRDDPLVALCAMDVVVNCSLDEPFGRVLIEAMACRRPVVAFASGAVPELVADGDTGVLVPVGNTATMAEAVFELIDDPTLAESYGEAGHERVATHFTLDASTRGVEAVYAELAAEGEAP